MKFLQLTITLAAAALIAGCMSPETRQKLTQDCDGRMLFQAVPIEIHKGPPEVITLDQDLTFRADTSALDKDIPYIVGHGQYELKYIGAEGRFYAGTAKTIRFGGVFGMKSYDGGFFVPNDKTRKYMLWIPDSGGSIGVATGGGVIMVGSGPSPDNVRWVIAVPAQVQSTIELKIAQLPNKSL